MFSEILPSTWFFIIIQSHLIIPSLVWAFVDLKSKSRLRFFFFNLFFFCYNLVNGAVPNAEMGIPVEVQNIIGWVVGLCLTVYYSYNLYAEYSVGLHSRVRVVYFYLIVGFTFIFLIPYLITKDLSWCRNNFLSITMVAGMLIVYDIVKSVCIRYKSVKDKANPLSAFIMLLSFLLFPLSIIVLGDNQVVVHLCYNLGYAANTYYFAIQIINGSPVSKNIDKLTPSEKKICYLILDKPNLTFKELGVCLYKSPHTLSKQASSMYGKLHVKNKLEFICTYKNLLSR